MNCYKISILKSTYHSKDYKDAFRIELPARYKLLKNTGSVNELYVHDFAKHFFTCNVFKYLERPLLVAYDKGPFNSLLEMLPYSKDGLLSDDKVLKYGAFKFRTHDKILVWKVIGREHNEILLKWEFGAASGTTWFCIPADENILLFGSSILVPRDNIGKEEIYKKETKHLFIDAGRTLPDEVPFGAKLKNFLIRTSLSVSLPIHQLYSKYLLVSTHKKIVNEEKDKRKPEIYF